MSSPNLKSYFFDSHLHLFNLSHPGFIMFLSRILFKSKLSVDDVLKVKLFKIIVNILGIALISIIFLLLIGSLFAIKLKSKYFSIYGVDFDLFFYPLIILISIIGVGVLFANKKKIEKINNDIKNILNTLYYIENDVANQLLLLERDFVSLDSKFTKSDYINGKYDDYLNENNIEEAKNIIEKERVEYSNRKPLINIDNTDERIEKVILTPLIMDFGYKKTTSDKIHYGVSPSKPMTEQIIDLYFGIHRYMSKSPYKIFKVYPFMGITPNNYDIKDIKSMLNYYFEKYDRNKNLFKIFEEKFEDRFNKEIISLDLEKCNESIHFKSLKDYFFAGIKLYPSLGCDLSPKDSKEKEKIKFIYKFCKKNKIPITIHFVTEGFGAAENVEKLTKPDKINYILNKYRGIYFNLAHFGLTEENGKYKETEWNVKIKKAISKKNKIYTDISCKPYDVKNKGLDEKIDKAIDQNPLLKQRTLFGSDIPVVLLGVDSYKTYLEKFIQLSNKKPNYKKFYRKNAYNLVFGK